MLVIVYNHNISTGLVFRILLYTRMKLISQLQVKGGCCSISDDLSCSIHEWAYNDFTNYKNLYDGE